MRPFYGLDDETDLPTTIFCGIQHVLAMFVGVVTPPLIIAGALDVGIEQTGFLVSMALFTSGLTTFLQVRRFGPVGSGLLCVQGTSFTFVPLAIQAGQAGGLSLVLGMALAGSPVEMILSRFIHVARRLFPPVVTGSVVMLIGTSLLEVGFTDLAGGAGAADFGSLPNLAMGGFVALVILLVHRFGSGFLRTSSIALGLVIGYGTAVTLGWVELGGVEEAGWVMLPLPLHFGLDFDVAYLLPWVIGYFVTTIESIGDLSATSEVSHQPVQGPDFVRRLQGGVMADGVGSLLAGLFNAMPNTTFSQNIGVIGLTGVAARRVGLTVAGLLVVLGVFPKLSVLIGLMPRPVLGGATVILFTMVTIAGIRIVGADGWTRRKELILAITLALGLGVALVPDWAGQLDRIPVESRLGEAALTSLKVILQSGLAVGAIVATVLNLWLPKDVPESR